MEHWTFTSNLHGDRRDEVGVSEPHISTAQAKSTSTSLKPKTVPTSPNSVATMLEEEPGHINICGSLQELPSRQPFREMPDHKARPGHVAMRRLTFCLVAVHMIVTPLIAFTAQTTDANDAAPDTSASKQSPIQLLGQVWTWHASIPAPALLRSPDLDGTQSQVSLPIMGKATEFVTPSRAWTWPGPFPSITERHILAHHVTSWAPAQVQPEAVALPLSRAWSWPAVPIRPSFEQEHSVRREAAWIQRTATIVVRPAAHVPEPASCSFVPCTYWTCWNYTASHALVSLHVQRLASSAVA